MSRIVCNTGPLIALGVLNRLDILKSLFSEVLIPEAVQKEITCGGTARRGIADFAQAKWIRVMSLKSGGDPVLESLLDAGEAAVITLALQESAELVLIDERKARKVARSIHGLHVIGTARILVEARRKNLLDSIGPCFKRLRNEGYWIHDSIVDAALLAVQESK